MNRKLFYMTVLILLLAGCDGRGNGRSVKFSGTLELTEHSLGAQAPGRLATLLVEEGSEVSPGQLLATLDRFDQAQKDFERAKALFQKGGATQQAVEYAQLNVDDQKISSPVKGVVLVKVREVGEVLAGGATVLVIGDRQDLWVRIYVPEGIINQVKMNEPATVSFDGLGQTFPGRVSFIASQAEFTPRNVQTAEERVTQTFAVKVRLVDPPVYLRPGVAADVVFDTRR